MNLKTGDRVKVIDGYGRTIVDQAVVTRYAGGGIVFVKECTADGLLYGLPISSISRASNSLRVANCHSRQWSGP